MYLNYLTYSKKSRLDIVNVIIRTCCYLYLLSFFIAAAFMISGLKYTPSTSLLSSLSSDLHSFSSFSSYFSSSFSLSLLFCPFYMVSILCPEEPRISSYVIRHDFAEIELLCMRFSRRRYRRCFEYTQGTYQRGP